MIKPKERLLARLPAVAITNKMKDDLQLISRQTKISVSELVRQSVSLFLQENSKYISTYDKKKSIDNEGK